MSVRGADARLASALWLLLKAYDIYDVDTLAENVRGAAGDLLADWLQSDDTRAAIEQAVAADEARAAAEIYVLDCELRAMEKYLFPLHAARGADAMAEELILREQLSKATAELVSTQRAAARRNEALKSTKSELAAANAKLGAAVQARDAAEQY